MKEKEVKHVIITGICRYLLVDFLVMKQILVDGGDSVDSLLVVLYRNQYQISQ